MKPNEYAGLSLIAASMALAGVFAAAQTAADTTIPRVPNPPVSGDLTNLPGDLRAAPVPGPSNLGDFVRDPDMTIALGKAFFWDMQVGSDGVQACASCHFRAGADPRSRNQVSPGLKHMPEPDFDLFDGQRPEPPAHGHRFSAHPTGNAWYSGRPGCVHGQQRRRLVARHSPPASVVDPLGFQVGGVNTRRVEPRNTPSMINAVFNHRQFWDGRAENFFNGVNHLGARDPAGQGLPCGRSESDRVEVRIALVNSSLASQAVAPIVSDLEMAAPGRTPAGSRARARRGAARARQEARGVRPLAKQ